MNGFDNEFDNENSIRKNIREFRYFYSWSILFYLNNSHLILVITEFEQVSLLS